MRVRPGWVPRSGGYDYVAEAFGGADIPEDRLRAFTGILQDDGGLKLEYFSRSAAQRQRSLPQ